MKIIFVSNFASKAIFLLCLFLVRLEAYAQTKLPPVCPDVIFWENGGECIYDAGERRFIRARGSSQMVSAHSLSPEEDGWVKIEYFAASPIVNIDFSTKQGNSISSKFSLSFVYDGQRLYLYENGKQVGLHIYRHKNITLSREQGYFKVYVNGTHVYTSKTKNKDRLFVYAHWKGRGQLPRIYTSFCPEKPPPNAFQPLSTDCNKKVSWTSFIGSIAPFSKGGLRKTEKKQGFGHAAASVEVLGKDQKGWIKVELKPSSFNDFLAIGFAAADKVPSKGNMKYGVFLGWNNRIYMIREGNIFKRFFYNDNDVLHIYRSKEGQFSCYLRNRLLYTWHGLSTEPMRVVVDLRSKDGKGPPVIASFCAPPREVKKFSRSDKTQNCVLWTHLSGVAYKKSEKGNVLYKTSIHDKRWHSCWKEGAASINKLPLSESGFIKVKVGNTEGKNYMVGLARENTSPDHNSIDYAVNIHGNTLKIHEKGHFRTAASLSEGDEIIVFKDPTQKVSYYLNDTLVYQSAEKVTKDLIIDASLCTLYKSTDIISTSFCTPEAGEVFTDTCGKAVAWSALTTGLASHGMTMLKKTEKDGWGNAGAHALEVLPEAQDGHISMTYRENSRVAIGFSSEPNGHYKNIAYGVCFDKNGILHIIDQGKFVRNTAVLKGDKVVVSRKNGVFKYFLRGYLLHTSPIKSEKSLQLAAALYYRNAVSLPVFASFCAPEEPFSTKTKKCAQGVIWSDFAGAVYNSRYGIEKGVVHKTIKPHRWLGCWNAGVASLNRLPLEEEGWIKIKPKKNTSKNYMIGLSKGNLNADYKTIDYAVHFLSDHFTVYEKGQQKKSEKLKKGDEVILFKDKKTKTLSYYLNNKLIYRSGVKVTTDLIADASLCTQYTSTDPIEVSFCAPTENFSPECEQGVVWKDRVGVGKASGGLIKTASHNGWNAGAASKNTLKAGKDGWVKIKIDKVSDSRYMVGFSDMNTNAGYKSIRFALYQVGKHRFEVYESGVKKASLSTQIKVGDELMIARKNGVIAYYLNGKRFHYTPSSNLSGGDLIVDASIHGQEGRINLVSTSFCVPADTPPSQMPPCPHGVVWKKLLGTRYDAAKQSIIKTEKGNAWGNAAAYSASVLPAGQAGRLTVVYDTLPPTNYFLGLSASDANLSYAAIGYGIHYNGGKVKVTELGKAKSALTTLKKGDKLYIERISKQVRYYLNDKLLHRSDLPSVSDLNVAVSLHTAGAKTHPMSITFCQTQGADKPTPDVAGSLWKKETDGSRNIYYDAGKVRVGIPEGKRYPAEYKLIVAGKTITEGVKVQLSSRWPDFVFDSAYRLPPLAEVENYIRKNRHLPELPSAKQIEKQGLELGEMDAKLLQKIEELTLYMIKLKKDTEALKKDNNQIRQENRTLRKTIDQKLNQ